MKIVSRLQSPLHSVGAGLLALVLGFLGWKREILRINVRACGLPWSLRFQTRWYYSVARDFLGAVFNCPGPPIHVRSRDLRKLDYLKGKPSLFLTAHVHNWERLAAWMPRQGIPLLGAARPLSSPLFDRLLTWVRARYGIPVVTRDVLSGAREHLRKGGCFGVLWDQHSPLSRRTSLFFGMPVAMDPLPEILLRRYRPRVVVGFLLPSGCFRVVEILSPDLNRAPKVGTNPKVRGGLHGTSLGGLQATEGGDQGEDQGVAQKAARGETWEVTWKETQGGTQEKTWRGALGEDPPNHGEPKGEVAGNPSGVVPGQPPHAPSGKFKKEFQANPLPLVPLASRKGSREGTKPDLRNETDLLLDRMTRRYHRVLESVVLAYPHLWYGFAHRRFKGVLPYPSTHPFSRPSLPHSPPRFHVKHRPDFP